jgi:hypothetical protein
MGRLDDIVARNQNPGKHRKGKFPFGIAVAAFVFLILVLLIFTDAGKSGDAPTTEAPVEPDAPKRARGIGLYVETSRDAAVHD